MRAIYKRELRSYFGSMYDYIFLAFTLCIMGVYLAMTVFLNQSSNAYFTFAQMAFFSVFLVPVLTMRTFAEERRNKTDMFLLSLPLTSLEIVLGKFFASWTVYAIPTLMLSLYSFVLRMLQGGASLLGAAGAALCEGVALLLLGGLMIAICTFISSLTDSIVLAAVGGFGALLCLDGLTTLSYLTEALDAYFPDHAATISVVGIIALIALFSLLAGLFFKSATMGVVTASVGIIPLSAAFVICSKLAPDVFAGLLTKILTYVSVFALFDSMTQGVFSISGTVFFVLAIAFCVYLSILSLEKRRVQS